MAETSNRSDEMGDIPGLIQSMLEKQEQQFRALFRESQMQNETIFRELGEIKQLASLRVDSKLLPPFSHSDLSRSEKRLGQVHSDHTSVDRTGAGVEVFGDRYFESEESINVENKTPDGMKKSDFGYQLDLDKVMQEKGILSPNSVGTEQEYFPPDSAEYKRRILIRGETSLKCCIKGPEDNPRNNDEPAPNLMEGIENQMRMQGLVTPFGSMVTEEKHQLDSIALLEKIELLKANAVTSDARCIELEDRIELERQAGRQSTMLQARVKELEQQAKQVEEKFSSLLQQQKERLQGELERVQKDKDEIAEKINAREKMVSVLLEEEDYYKKKVAQQDKQIDELRSKADDLVLYRNKFVQLEEKHRELELNFQKRSQEYQQWYNQSTQRQSELQLQNSELSTRQRQLEESRHAINEYQRVIREKDDKLAQARREVDDKDGMIKAQQITNNDLEAEMATMSGRSMDSSHKLKEENERLRAELKQELLRSQELQVEKEAKKNLELQQQMYPNYFPYGAGGPMSMFQQPSTSSASVAPSASSSSLKYSEN